MGIIKSECITCKVRSCSILNTCDRNTLDSISYYKQSKPLKKGERLFSEGETIHGIYFIKKGFLKVEVIKNHNRPLIIQFVGRGGILGHRANTEHKIHTTTAIAVSDVEYCFIPLNSFGKILDKSPILQQQILNQFLEELQLIENKAFNLANKTVREKVAESILLFADFYEYEEKKKSFKINFCRLDIANLAGTTKEQVSKIMKDFERENLIKCTAKKFNYLNIEGLQALCNGKVTEE